MADTTQTLEEKLAAIAQAMEAAAPAEAPKSFACPVDPDERSRCEGCQ